VNVEDHRPSAEKVIVYNTFSPNGDGFNDVFPETKPNYFYEITVYNRWGLKVYEGKDEPWNGDRTASGTYFYTMKLKSCDVEEEIIGVITMLK
jgi:gliding motility-associated-like protein